MTAVALAPFGHPAIEIDDYLVLASVALAPVRPASFLVDSGGRDPARDNSDADLTRKCYLGGVPDGHGALLHEAIIDEGAVGTGVLEAENAVQEKQLAMVT